MTLTGFPEYKVSDIEWINSVPTHWGKVPLKYMATEKGAIFIDGDWIESKDISSEGIRYITTGNVGEGKYKEQGSGYITEEKFRDLGCTEVFEGDILISRLNPPIGRSCIVPNLNSRIVTSVDNVIFRPNTGFSRSYLRFAFSSKAYFGHTRNLARGATMQRISRGQLGNIRLPMPPLDEQVSIATFLENETARIDRLIEKQQHLIALLKEKRQTVIAHAVTRGLDPDAPMKDSGVEWLGDVPTHWSYHRLKWLFDIKKRISGELGYEVLSVTQKGIKVKDTESGEGQLSMDYSKYQLVFRGDFVMNHMDLLTGWVDISAFDGVTSPDYRVFVLTDESVSPRYMLYLLQLGYNEKLFYAFGQGSSHLGRWRFPTGSFKDFIFPVPPLNEQNQIAKFIKNEHKKIENVVKKCSLAIGLMKERRTALISAAVTGKIDVRNHPSAQPADKAVA